MSTFQLSGCVVPMITPLVEKNKQFTIDTAAVSSLVDSFIASKISAIFILGNAGAFQFLTLDQKHQLLIAVNTIAAGRIPVIVGITSDDLNHTRQLISWCHTLAISALVWIPDFQSNISIAEILAVTDLPLILYNNPHICGGKSLSPFSVSQWLQIYPGKIIGVKESSGDFATFKKFISLQQEYRLPIMQGDAKNLVTAKTLETDLPWYHLSGGVPVHANVEPENYSKFLSGDLSLSSKIVDYIVDYPNIDATISRLVELGTISPATSTFWFRHH